MQWQGQRCSSCGGHASAKVNRLAATDLQTAEVMQKGVSALNLLNVIAIGLAVLLLFIVHKIYINGVADNQLSSVQITRPPPPYK